MSRMCPCQDRWSTCRTREHDLTQWCHLLASAGTLKPWLPGHSTTPLLATKATTLSAGGPQLTSTARQTVPRGQRQRQSGAGQQAAAQQQHPAASPTQLLLPNNDSPGMPMPAAGPQMNPFQTGKQQGVLRPAGAAPKRPYFISDQLLSSRSGASGKANVAPCRSHGFYAPKARTKLDVLVCFYRVCLKAPQTETLPINPSVSRAAVGEWREQTGACLLAELCM